MEKISVIIVAAGSGSRFGSQLPKQFCLLQGRPVFMHAIDSIARGLRSSEKEVEETLDGTLDGNREVDVEFVVAVSPQMCPFVEEILQLYNPQEKITLTYGGTTRWESIKKSLALVGDDRDYVLVHDAARPIVEDKVSRGVLEALRAGAIGAIPAIVPSSSMRIVDADGLSQALDRSRCREIQTPQGFPLMIHRKAYELPFRDTFTDDASVVEAAELGDIVLTEGSAYNIKITHPLDLKIAALYLDNATT